MDKVVKIKHVVGVILLALISRKIFIGHEAMKVVESCKSQVSTSQMEPTLILILNKHALNMTFNWLCNTVDMPNVHRRSLIVTLDEEADVAVERAWPNVRRLNWPVKCLSEPFNYGDGKYQLFYLFRSNLAQAFLQLNRPFWMIQQDTFWRESMLELESEIFEHNDQDIVFDRAAETAGSLIAGGYYMAKSTNRAKNFFSQLSADLEWFYAPDNTYMTSLCSRKDLVTCGQIPFSAITNWIWLHEPSRFRSQKVPMLVQFDGDTKLGGKLAKMRSLGFYFLNSDGTTCNAKSVAKAQNRVLKWAGMSGHLDAAGVRSYSHWQFGFYQAIIDQLYKFKMTEWLLNHVIFPYAHYFMLKDIIRRRRLSIRLRPLRNCHRLKPQLKERLEQPRKPMERPLSMSPSLRRLHRMRPPCLQRTELKRQLRPSRQNIHRTIRLPQRTSQRLWSQALVEVAISQAPLLHTTPLFQAPSLIQAPLRLSLPRLLQKRPHRQALRLNQLLRLHLCHSNTTLIIIIVVAVIVILVISSVCVLVFVLIRRSNRRAQPSPTRTGTTTFTASKTPASLLNNRPRNALPIPSQPAFFNPEVLPASKFKHRGAVVLSSDEQTMLPPHSDDEETATDLQSLGSTEPQIFFDDTMNEAYDIGSEVEIVMKNGKPLPRKQPKTARKKSDVNLKAIRED
ncbi:Nucleotid-trans domain-containing protein [Aphelenchoides besseyi]|nr:Nucleotid-trans domain-containing protein [Aphelenchoides besseyi]